MCVKRTKEDRGNAAIGVETDEYNIKALNINMTGKSKCCNPDRKNLEQLLLFHQVEAITIAIIVKVKATKEEGKKHQFY